MSAQELSGSTALVTGASRGFGRGVAIALAGAGADVIGVARDRAALEEVRALIGDGFTPVAADAADPVVAGRLTDAYRPRVLVLAAGVAPLSRPLHRQTWETFSSTWNVDVRQVFHWLREALLRPLEPGSVVIAFSSAARSLATPITFAPAPASAMAAPRPKPRLAPVTSAVDPDNSCADIRNSLILGLSGFLPASILIRATAGTHRPRWAGAGRPVRSRPAAMTSAVPADLYR